MPTKTDSVSDINTIPDLVVPAEDTPQIRGLYCEHNLDFTATIDKSFWADAEEAKISRRCTDGAEQGPAAFVRFRWTPEALLFYAEVERPEVDIINDNSKLWLGSNVEFLFATRWFVRPFYNEYEFLFNSNGGFNSLRWSGNRNLDKAASWHVEGLKWHTLDKLSFHSNMDGWAFEGQIPFSTFQAVKPECGDYWGLGLYRSIRLNDSSQRFLAWSPTLTNPPAFHTPSKFGMILFDKP